MNASRKIVVIGGTGLIGSKAVALLRDAGHDVYAASPATGVDTITGEGLDRALSGADIVIDVSNIGSMDGDVVRTFFETSGRNLLAAEERAKVRHHVTLSIVGTDGLPGNGYLRAKVAQEDLVRTSGVPHTIVRATQFFEFIPSLADAYTQGGTISVPDCLFQPIAAGDVAAALVEVALGQPRNATVEVAGPERGPFKEIVRRYLHLSGDGRPVESDPAAGYFGASVDSLSLVPRSTARLGPTGLDAWFNRNVAVV